MNKLTSLVEKVDYLFRQVRHPSGREYTVEEVAQALGKPTAYVSRLRRGDVATPGVEVLGGLSDFFGVARMYWFRPATYLDEHDPNYPYANRPLRAVTPEEVVFVAEVQDRLRVCDDVKLESPPVCGVCL